MLTQPMLLAGLALVCSLVLAFRHRPLVFPVIASVVSALEVLMVFGLVHVSVARLPLHAIFGGALILSGIAIYLRSQNKLSVASATTVTLIGALQLLSSLHLH
jgi:hypothetical protein